MDTHKYAEAFPMASDAELREMAEDIRQRGLLCPIITLDGKVLDGRNRLKACQIAGVEPRFQKYAGADPLADVVSWNLKRRQLTVSQRAEVARTLKPMFADQARERMLAGKAADPKANLPEGWQARDQAAAAVGVSGRSVQDAEYVHTHAPELSEEIKAGRMTVNAAKREAKKREASKSENRPTDPLDNGKTPTSTEVYTSETMAGLKRYWKKATKKERKEFLAWVKKQ
jgi:ParB-like chromosome segregation protein Spo0J